MVETKKIKNAKIKDIIRLFFQYDIEAFPIVDKSNQFKGLVFKHEVINHAGEVSFIEKPFSFLVSQSLFYPNESEFLQYISRLNETLEFPVLNLKGELLSLWKKSDLLNLYYSINSPKKKPVSGDQIDQEIIIDSLNLNFLIVNSKNKIIHASRPFLENLDFKKEILLNQSIQKIFPKVNIIRSRELLHPHHHSIKYQHQDWRYFIFEMKNSGKEFFIYLFMPFDKPLFTQDLDEMKEKIVLDLKEKKPLNEMIESQEKELIKNVLEENQWNISHAARILKIPRQTLQYKISKYKIS
ncbi:MAG: hypothetical protein JW827_09980 [Spirochaetes bacterium]|nr:hypothetical protein [Spirochaetota bacterium]